VTETHCGAFLYRGRGEDNPKYSVELHRMFSFESEVTLSTPLTSLVLRFFGKLQ